jgi:hypothetical protein
LLPKLGAITMLLAAGTAAHYGQQPLPLTIATFAAAAGLLGALVNRWAALPAMLVATAGLLVVFVSFALSKSGVTWAQSAAMVTYGLTMLTSLMILVEQKGQGCELS